MSINSYQTSPKSAIDGGWGWFVTFSSFMIGVILGGISWSFGMFYPELLDYYGESKRVTAWVISTLNGTFLGTGPFTSMLITRFGCKRAGIGGCTIMAAAFISSTFASNISVVIIVYGVVGGIGYGLLYSSSILVIGSYFSKKKAFASGIVACGSSVGGFLFAPFCQTIIDRYTWKGAMWIISAISLHGICCALVYRPIKSRTTHKAELFTVKDYSYDNEQIDDNTTGNRDFHKNSKVNSYSNPCDFTLNENAVVRTQHQEQVTHGDDSQAGSSRSNSNSVMAMQFERKAEIGFRESAISLVKSWTFLLLAVSSFTGMLGFYIPFTYFPALASDIGLQSDRGAYLISIIGVTNTIARLLIGYVADRPWANAVTINGVLMVVGGLVTMFVEFYCSFLSLGCSAAVFGVAISGFICLRPIILIELFGVGKFTTSFGLITMFQGAAALIGAPAAGSLVDESGKYSSTFYFAGIALTLSGVMCLPLNSISAWESSRNKRTSLN